MTRSRRRAPKLAVLACAAGASLLGASSWPLSTVAAASAVPKVSVSPRSVSPRDEYYATTHGLAGTGAVVTVTVGPNKVLRPGFPVEVQECNAAPTSISNCDVLTTLEYDQLTKRRVLAAANGSVKIHFLLWAPLPDKWDPGSVIDVSRGHATALWIGDDPSEWASTGFVTPTVQVLGAPAKPGHTAPGKLDHGGTTGAVPGASASHGPDRATEMAIGGLAAVAVAAALVVVIGWRRRRLVPGHLVSGRAR